MDFLGLKRLPIGDLNPLTRSEGPDYLGKRENRAEGKADYPLYYGGPGLSQSSLENSLLI